MFRNDLMLEFLQDYWGASLKIFWEVFMISARHFFVKADKNQRNAMLVYFACLILKQHRPRENSAPIMHAIPASKIPLLSVADSRCGPAPRTAP